MPEKKINRMTSSNKKISRTIGLVFPEYNEKDKLTEALRRELNMEITNLNSRIATTIGNINCRVPRLIPTITIGSPIAIRLPANDMDNFLLKDSRATTTRVIIVSFDWNANQCTKETLIQRGISHLIEIAQNSETFGWRKSEKIVSVTVNVNKDKLIDLVEDIILDIAMYHSWDNFVGKNNYSTIEYKIEFSKRKVEYARKKGLSNHIGEIEEGIDYFSISSACRKEDGSIDFDKVESYWFDFMVNEIVNAEKNPIDPIEQLKNHKDYNQLPLKLLEKQIQCLNKGCYLLARIIGKPRRKQVRKNLLQLFRKSKFSCGKTIIVPFEQYRLFEPFNTYISFFKLEV